MTTSPDVDEINTSEHSYGFDPIVAVKCLAQSDATLAQLMALAGPFQMQVRVMHSPFETLLRNIIHQQLHGTAAEAIHNRVQALVGNGRLRPQALLAASEEALRAAGLSRAKIASIKDLAAKTLDGTVPPLARLQRMDDEEIIKHLTAVRGIGRWTVEMLLMFRLGRPDVLPVGDYAVRRGFALVYGLKELPKPKELAQHGAKHWRPFCTVASWYMWRALELPAGALPVKTVKKAKGGSSKA